jgi:hypothetical protein
MKKSVDSLEAVEAVKKLLPANRQLPLVFQKQGRKVQKFPKRNHRVHEAANRPADLKVQAKKVQGEKAQEEKVRRGKVPAENLPPEKIQEGKELPKKVQEEKALAEAAVENRVKGGSRYLLHKLPQYFHQDAFF